MQIGVRSLGQAATGLVASEAFEAWVRLLWLSTMGTAQGAACDACTAQPPVPFPVVPFPAHVSFKSEEK
jgi:hypothetical protein